MEGTENNNAGESQEEEHVHESGIASQSNTNQAAEKTRNNEDYGDWIPPGPTTTAVPKRKYVKALNEHSKDTLFIFSRIGRLYVKK